MPTRWWRVKWKRNRNHRGVDVLPEKEAILLAEEKKELGFKVELVKLPRNWPGTLTSTT